VIKVVTVLVLNVLIFIKLFKNKQRLIQKIFYLLNNLKVVLNQIKGNGNNILLINVNRINKMNIYIEEFFKLIMIDLSFYLFLQYKLEFFLYLKLSIES